ncbi:transposase [Porphyromonas sp.]|uniref:transposase n=1 Tax=Porphyromonas sp. TaxID=1924944 RepID=UPI0026DDB5D6|nr:transposase [Porphyromonas sp.]MDO4770943.1 transposase [Porphyromonas sp.]
MLSLSAPRNIDDFTYLRFPEGVHRMIYSTNRVERLNRSYKRRLRLRGALPSADAVVFLLGSVAREMTERTYARRLPYFQDRSIK